MAGLAVEEPMGFGYTAIGTEGDMIQGSPAVLQADISAKEKGDRLGF
jgi:hypothetical protein